MKYMLTRNAAFSCLCTWLNGIMGYEMTHRLWLCSNGWYFSCQDTCMGGRPRHDIYVWWGPSPCYAGWVCDAQAWERGGETEAEGKCKYAPTGLSRLPLLSCSTAMHPLPPKKNNDLSWVDLKTKGQGWLLLPFMIPMPSCSPFSFPWKITMFLRPPISTLSSAIEYLTPELRCGRFVTSFQTRSIYNLLKTEGSNSYDMYWMLNTLGIIVAKHW